MKKFTLFLLVQFITFNFSFSQNWNLKWQDNFEDNASPNTSVWTLEEDGWGGGNSELQCYIPNNVTIETYQGLNCLVLSAKKENYTWALKNKLCPATSGRVNTQGKVYFKYGKVESRMKLPKTANGLWPAFWFMGNDRTFNINNFDNSWPACGEIDLMECGNSGGIASNSQAYNFGGALHWGTISPYIHYMDYTSINAPYSIQDDDFHLYTLIWNADSIIMYLDQDKYPTVKPFYAQRIQNGSNTPNGGGGNFSYIYDQFHKPFYILYNLAIGGSYTGIYDINNITALASDGSASKMYIDFVRIYQKGDAGEEFYSATTYSDLQAPTLTSATLGAVTRTTAEIIVNGTDNSGSVIYSVSANGKIWTAEGANGKQKSVIATGLYAGTTYNFTITAKDASGNLSSTSIPVVATTGSNSDCEGISNVAFQGTFDTGYNFSFVTSGANVTINFEMLDNKAGVVAYLWDYTSGSLVETQMTNVSGKIFSITLTGKTAGSIIKVHCKFAYAGGMNVTKQLSYTVGNNCGTSAIETITTSDIRFYPNPATDWLNIKAGSEIQEIHLKNLLGQTVKIVKVNEWIYTLDISNIPSGNYLIVSKMENGQQAVNRIVKK